MRTTLVVAIACAAISFGASVNAQTSAAARGYAAVKVGANVERAEDDLHGASAGVGALAGVPLSEKWALEAEFWRPGYIITSPEGGRHRDTLLGIDARRSFGGGRVRPHLLFGAMVGWTQDQFTVCIAMRTPPGSTTQVQALVPCEDRDVIDRRLERFDSMGLFPLIGAGVEIALTRRVRLIPDVRVQIWSTSFIARPAIAVGVVF